MQFNIKNIDVNQPVPKLIVKIFVIELSNKTVIREFVANIYKSDRRRWLLDLTTWAMRNGKSIEIVSINDFIKEKEE